MERAIGIVARSFPMCCYKFNSVSGKVNLCIYLLLVLEGMATHQCLEGENIVHILDSTFITIRN